jgi:formamidopyrimidine-DNA glycosylase
MPELPEVETICRGITPFILNKKITKIIINRTDLRWPIPKNLSSYLKKSVISQITRRSKYILLTTTKGTVIIHLGMSGKLLILPKNHTPIKHEHVIFHLDNGYTLSFVDPRRFGTILWTTNDPNEHKLIKPLGLEPFASNFNGSYLQAKAVNRKISIKQFLMNNSNVSGMGNIYTNEALFLAKLNPQTLVTNISAKQWQSLAKQIQVILNQAIEQGGTTLKDYRNSENQQGNFKVFLQVYDRKDLKCYKCNNIIQHFRQNQRSTYFCPQCQKK